ncbi:hypothetical protein GCM10010405_52310 [Streptomyces macrosporus]|uniref:Uncharacterized protein n=1 Tax=Streptomyces macrosporus TaxID=44032 RepID=A0ABP5XNG8_9ACTN
MVEDGTRDPVAGAVLLVRRGVRGGTGVAGAVVDRHDFSRLLTSVPFRRAECRPAGRAFFTTLLLRNSKERGKPRSDQPEWDASRKACLTRRHPAGRPARPRAPRGPGPSPVAAAP